MQSRPVAQRRRTACATAPCRRWKPNSPKTTACASPAWIDNRLRQTACDVGDFAGAVALRRLNRREYHNTIRDLLGVDYNVSELFPNDGTGGSGFDTNGETLFIPPLLVERYLEAAQQILDRAIVTPDLAKSFPAQRANSSPGKELTAMVSIYVDGDYDVQAAVERKDGMGTLPLKVDGAAAVPLKAQQPQGRGGGGGGADAAPARPPVYGVAACAWRAVCACSRWSPKAAPVPVVRLTVQQRPADPAPEKLALHYRLLGAEPGSEPLQARKAAEQILRTFCARPTGARWRPPTSRRYDPLRSRGAARRPV